MRAEWNEAKRFEAMDDERRTADDGDDEDEDDKSHLVAHIHRHTLRDWHTHTLRRLLSFDQLDTQLELIDEDLCLLLNK